jgi:molybdopterin biosynthesis enzyme MoaB
MKATIKYPVLTVSFKEVELTKEDAETLENCTESEKADIIEKYLSEDEKEHIPGTIESALDYDYASIKFNS